MKTQRLDDATEPGYRREQVTLDDGETAPCAGSTRKQWIGPGTFVRTTYADGAREEMAETALVVPS